MTIETPQKETNDEVKIACSEYKKAQDTLLFCIYDMHLKNQIIPDTFLNLTSKYFTDKYKDIYDAMKEAVTTNKKIDFAFLQGKNLEDYYDYFHNKTLEIKHIDWDNSLSVFLEKRRAIKIYQFMVNHQNSAPGVILEQGKKLFSEDNTLDNNPIFTPEDHASKMMEFFSTREAKREGVLTNIDLLDDTLGGFNPGIYVLGARPGMGKTTFATTIFADAVINQNKSCLFFSLETKWEDIFIKVVSHSTGIPYSRLMFEQNLIDDDQYAKIGKFLDTIIDKKFSIIEPANQPNLNLERMVYIIKKYAQTQGLDMVVIDYVQLIRLEKRSDDLRMTMVEVTRALKQLSMELSIPIILLAQADRQTDNKKTIRRNVGFNGDDEITIFSNSDLKESGSIEADADVVVFINKLDKGRFYLQITKARIVRKVLEDPYIPIRFDLETATFHDVNRRRGEERQKVRVVTEVPNTKVSLIG